MTSAVERAEFLRQLGRFDDAERAVREALAEAPEDPRLLAVLGSVLYGAGRFTEGLAAAEAACAGAPEAGAVHHVRAALLSALGRHPEAIDAARTAVSLAPEDAGPAMLHAQVLGRAGRLREAADAVRRAIALAPESAAAHLLLADIAGDLKDRRTARRGYEEALRLDPRNALARHDLAVLDANTRHPGRALRGLVEAGTLDPTLPIVLQTITVVLWHLSWRLRMLFVVATVATGIASLPGPGDQTSSARIAAAVALAIIGLLTWWTIRSLPSQTRPAVRAALRTDRPLSFTYAAIAVCVMLFLLVVATGIGALAAGVWFVLMLLGVLAAVVRIVRWLRRRLRR